MSTVALTVSRTEMISSFNFAAWSCILLITAVLPMGTNLGITIHKYFLNPSDSTKVTGKLSQIIKSFIMDFVILCASRLFG